MGSIPMAVHRCLKNGDQTKPGLFAGNERRDPRSNPPGQMLIAIRHGPAASPKR